MVLPNKPVLTGAVRPLQTGEALGGRSAPTATSSRHVERALPAPVGRTQRTVRDLVRLLQSAPRPDDAYLDAVEEVANNQPTLPEVPWES